MFYSINFGDIHKNELCLIFGINLFPSIKMTTQNINMLNTILEFDKINYIFFKLKNPSEFNKKLRIIILNLKMLGISTNP